MKLTHPEIRKVVASCLAAAQPSLAEVPRDSYYSLQAKIAALPFIAPLVASLAEYADVPPELVTLGVGSASLMRPDWFAAALIVAADQVGVADALVQFQSGFEEDQDAMLVLIVWGAEVHEELALSEDDRLVSLQSLPPTPTLQDVLDEFEGRFTSEFGLNPSRLPSALVRRVRVKALFPGYKSVDINHHAGDVFDMKLIAAGLSIQAPSVIVVGGAWVDFTGPLHYLKHGSAGMFGDNEVMPDGLASRTFGSEVRGLVAMFLRRARRDHRFYAASQRLNLSMRRRDPADAALDVSTALEILLVTDESSEITFRLALRAALLLGSDITERIGIRATIKALYALRSKAVHSGKVPARIRVGSLGEMYSAEVVRRGIEICAELIKYLTLRDEDPDWNLIELGR